VSFAKKISVHASEDRLEHLIEERLVKGAKKDEIDSRIWDLFGEEWAIVYTDMAGFSRNVAEFGIIHFLQIVHESKKILIPCIDRFDGILLKTEGDSMLIIFRNTSRAVECAIAMQHCAKKYNKDKIPEEQIMLCVGMGFGKVLRIGDTDVFGSEVNAACKLGEDLAKAGDILITGAVHEALKVADVEKLPTPPSGAKSAYRLIYAL
jgi:adenylate cyclase